MIKKRAYLWRLSLFFLLLILLLPTAQAEAITQSQNNLVIAVIIIVVSTALLIFNQLEKRKLLKREPGLQDYFSPENILSYRSQSMNRWRSQPNKEANETIQKLHKKDNISKKPKLNEPKREPVLQDRSSHSYITTKYCPKCNKSFSEDKNFCDNCGNKLEPKIEEYFIRETKNARHGISPLLVPWIVFCVMLLLAGAILLPTKAVSYNVKVPYEDIEEYIAKVPYETTEPYIESIPIQTQSSIKYIAEWEACTSAGESTVKITNTDSEAGIFAIQIGYTDNSGNFIADTQSKTVSPPIPVTFTYSPTPTSFQQCSYRIINVPVKTTTAYKDVIKEKTVTKYRDETRYRKVTKTRNETRQKEVNWLFGFDALIKFKNLGQ